MMALLSLSTEIWQSVQFFVVPFFDMLLFSSFVIAALSLRKHKEAHKRLMLLATITLLPAAVARLPFDFIQRVGPAAFFGLADLFVIPLLVYDIATRGRPHRATVLGALLIIGSHLLRIPIGMTQAWLSFAAWITQWS